MKKLLLITAMFAAAGSANAQDGLRFGVKTGINFATLKMKSGEYSSSNSSVTSFHFGGFVDVPVSARLSIQPGLTLSGKGMKMGEDDDDTKANLMYVDVPVNAVTRIDAGPGKVFLGAGPYLGYGLSGKIKGPDGKQDVKFGKDEELRRLDLGLGFIGGYQLPSGFNFNLGYQLGIKDIEPEAGNDNSESSTKNRVFSISVGYLF
ncbi:porin family protein [Arcticibacter sp. MXS-1]|uniref:porin family protein n=1 Tax=Arcticibacter sp. MXS-1 TaxID=3341726 RepID=UPI0035A9686E